MTTAGELWLNSELARVRRAAVTHASGQRDPARVRPDSAPAGPQSWGSTASTSSNMPATVSRSPYGPYSGPALTDEDVRRLEHPEEFR